MDILDQLLDDIQVIDNWEHEDPNLSGWYAVVNTKGIIAYFGNERDACRFRLSYINRILNP